MSIDLSTPALLFPAISLLMLAYTNRFLALSTLVRGLAARYGEHPEPRFMAQIENLRHRLMLIRSMQALGVASLFVDVGCMFALFAGRTVEGKVLFGASLVLLMTSLGYSFREIQLSTRALNIELETLKGAIRPAPPSQVAGAITPGP